MKRQQLGLSPRSVCGHVHTAHSPAMAGAPFHSPKNTKKVGAYKSKPIPSSKTKKSLTKKKHTDSKMRSTAKAAERKKQTDGKMRIITKVAVRKKQTDCKAAVEKEIQKLKKGSNFKISKDEVGRLEDFFILSRTTIYSKNTTEPTDTSKISETIYTSFEKKIQDMSNGKKRRMKINLRKQLLEAEKQRQTLETQQQILEVQRQNQYREERLKQRREIASLPADELEKRMKQQSKQKKPTAKKEKTIDVDNKIEERELTEYEKLRLQKIKRNENRLKELGLLDWKIN